MRKRNNNTKVVFLGRYNETDILSGPEKVAKRIFTEQTKNHPGIFIQYFFDGRKFGFWKKLFGYERTVLNNTAVVMTLGLVRIFFYLLKTKPQLIHVITFERFAVIAYILKIFTSIKFVYSVHGVIYYENYLLKEISAFYKLKDKICENIFIHKSDLLVFPSQQAIKLASEYFNLTERIIRIIPHGVDDTFVNSTKKTGKFSICLISSKIGLGNNIETVRNALIGLKFVFTLHIVGADIEMNLSESEIVFYKKMTSHDFSELLSRVDAFISLNTYDTFSISAFEAMASGCCVIVSKETGMSAFIKHNENGYIVDSGDSEEVQNVISQLYQDTRLKKYISDNARATAKKQHWGNVFNSYEAIYKELL